MNRREAGGWPQDDLRFVPAENGTEVWVNARLSSEGRRALHPLRVEIVSWCAAAQELRSVLHLIERFFDGDSVLAAVVRQDDAHRFLVYTGCGEARAHARYRGVRAALRPAAIGVVVALDPSWECVAAGVGSVCASRGIRSEQRTGGVR